MTTLIDAVLDLIVDTPLERAKQLSTAIGVLTDNTQAYRLEAWALTPHARELLDDVLAAWRGQSTTPTELAGIVSGASAAYHHAKAQQKIEFVWTGPSSSLVATRNTEQVLLQVIQAAERRLFVTSFVAYQVASVMEALRQAMARGVQLSLLLEPSGLHGGRLSFDAIGPMKKALPQAHILTWAKKEGRFVGGIVHAKIAVADEAVCFVSSANLTAHAMDKNMEAGVLIRGGSVPRDLHRHLEALETTRIISGI